MKAILVSLLIYALAQMAAADCIAPWGRTVREGDSVTAYQSPHSGPGMPCWPERRMCMNGYLTGSYQYEFCLENWPSEPAFHTLSSSFWRN